MNIRSVTGSSCAVERHIDQEAPTHSNDISVQPSATEEAPRSTTMLQLDGDIGAQVAALAILSGQKQREAGRDLQVAEEAALERAESAQVAAMHEKADDIRTAGYVEGGFGMISGACTMSAGFASSENAKLEWKGLATMSEGGGKYFSGIPKGAQTDDQANADTQDHEAAHHRRNLDAARDAVREGQDLLDRALDFYKQSQQGAAEAANSSLRRA